jgi:hypothetical protein
VPQSMGATSAHANKVFLKPDLPYIVRAGVWLRHCSLFRAMLAGCNIIYNMILRPESAGHGLVRGLGI